MTLDDDLAAARGRRGLSKVTLALAAALLLAAGVLAGIMAQKTFGGTAGGPGFQARGGFPGGQGGSPDGQGGFPQGQGGFPDGQGGPTARPGTGQRPGGLRGDVTLGTIEKIDGDRITLRTAAGATVEVTVKDGTPVQISRQGKITDLTPGGLIIVQGQKDADGNLTATSVSQGGARR